MTALNHFICRVSEFLPFSVRTRKDAGSKSLQRRCKEIAQVIKESQMSFSLSKIVRSYLVQLDLLKG